MEPNLMKSNLTQISKIYSSNPPHNNVNNYNK